MKRCSSPSVAASRTLWWWRLTNTRPAAVSTSAAADSGRGLCHCAAVAPRSCAKRPASHAISCGAMAGQSAGTSSLLRPWTRWEQAVMAG